MATLTATVTCMVMTPMMIIVTTTMTIHTRMTILTATVTMGSHTNTNMKSSMYRNRITRRNMPPYISIKNLMGTPTATGTHTRMITHTAMHMMIIHTAMHMTITHIATKSLNLLQKNLRLLEAHLLCTKK
mmetsp:Transcript_2462/g.3243  ORF Transcript_2462/g.3243 Transcript_2462/m.3243 type:complete len:130 (-) Transcript_2462:287-676(-)